MSDRASRVVRRGDGLRTESFVACEGEASRGLPVDGQRAYVYMIVHRETGRIYIGKTINPWERWIQHRYGSFAIGRAIREHGEDDFRFLVIGQYPDESSAYDAEMRWVALLGTTHPSRGFNRCGGGLRGMQREILIDILKQQQAEDMASNDCINEAWDEGDYPIEPDEHPDQPFDYRRALPRSFPRCHP